MRDGIDDASYQSIFEPIVKHVIDWYKPGAIVMQFGSDSLADYRLGCFNLSSLDHARCAEFIRELNIPTIFLGGGGGYTIRNVARCWTFETSVILGCSISQEIPFNDYFKYYGPDYGLLLTCNNMENLNILNKWINYERKQLKI